MAAGDGVSLPTTLAQMSSVAKAQASGQHSAGQAVPFAGHLAGEGELQVRRVSETQETAQNQVDPEQQSPDKRKRRRLKRNQKQLTDADAELSRGHFEEQNSDEGDLVEQLGVLLDLRV